MPNGSRSAGWSGSEGIVHTGIGPFDIQSGSYMAYGKVGYTRDALRVTAFGNFLDVEAPNLLLTDPATLEPQKVAALLQSGDVVVVKGSKKMFWVNKFVPKLLAALQAKA